jgi:pyridinium-3,5-bisthiocarboxylic acid mononucleotide nickel chelatase
MAPDSFRYHLDCASGLAGDMFLGACLDLGMPLDLLTDTVARLGLPGVSVESRKALRGGVTGTRFRVLENGRPIEGPDPDEAHAHEHHHHHDHHHHHHHDHHHHDHHHGRDLASIRGLIAESGLAAPVKERAVRLFQRLGEAEAKIHGMEVDRVHFHEVGAIDSIVDLAGAAAAIEFLAPARLTCGPVNVGSGRVRTAHGELPVPAPATAELLRGIPVWGGPGGELTTPTGAVLLAELVDEFVELPPLVLDGIGYGLGKRDLPGQPNAVRLVRGVPRQAMAAMAAMDAAGEGSRPQVAVLEAEIDDLPGEGFGFLMERLLDAGALDVYFTAVQMKKNRPGTLVTVLCRPPQIEPLAALLLVESGSLGCRYHLTNRFEAEREVVDVATAFGTVRVKRARFQGRQVAESPEFEDCRRLALAAGVPWREVYRAALS